MRKYTVETPDASGFSYIDANEAFRFSRENAKKQRGEPDNARQVEDFAEESFLYAHYMKYEMRLGEKRFRQFLEMSDEEQGEAFHEIYEDRLRSAGRTPTDSALKTLDGYIEWFLTGNSIDSIQQQRSIRPGQLWNMINRMPGYVVEGWRSHFPGPRIDLAKLAIDSNVLTYDFAATAGPSRRYAKSADVFHLTEVTLEPHS